MKLLVVTQTLDPADPILGFFHRWVEELAKHFSSVSVVANRVGECGLPSNVSVYSLGKEKNTSRLRRYFRFLYLMACLLPQHNGVFFHMIPEFVVAAAPFLIIFRKKSVLWYAHKSVTTTLRLAEHLVSMVVTASPESFRLPSKKVHYTGHAIDTKIFFPSPKSESDHSSQVRLLSLGRISPVKGNSLVIEAAASLLRAEPGRFHLSIVGGPAMEGDNDELLKLKEQVRHLNIDSSVEFVGQIPYTDIAPIYQSHDIFISLSETGSVDKAVLEAMAVGLTVLTSNEAFRNMLPSVYFLEDRTADILMRHIRQVALEARPNLKLREIVEEHHSLVKTISAIAGLIKG